MFVSVVFKSNGATATGGVAPAARRAPGLVLEFGRRALRKWVAINRSLQLASFVRVHGKGLAGFQGWVNLLQCYTFPDSVLLYVENVQLCF